MTTPWTDDSVGRLINRAGRRELDAVVDVLTAPHKSRGRRAVGSPSFREKMDERIRRRRYLLKFTNIVPVSQPLVNKIKRDRIMAALDFPVPARFLDAGSTEQVLELLDSHQELVIKPVSGASSSGVMLLRRVADGWLDLRTEHVHKRDAIITQMRSLRHKGKPIERWFAERLVVGDGNRSGYPMDYKFYMFQDGCGLILAKQHLADGSRFRWLSPDWRDVETGKYSNRIDPTLPLPANREELLEVARSISAAIPLAFVRVDLIRGRDGVYLSELSPLPGQYDRFEPKMDRHLGTMWEVTEFENGLAFFTAERFKPALSAIRSIARVDRVYPD